MVLGQPWLFSHSTRIDYIHEMGVTLQLWENGDRKGRLILINLPLIKVLQNVMPIRLRCGCESYSASYNSSLEAGLVCLGTNPCSLVVPRFMKRAEEALKIRELESEKPGPIGLNKDLILESALSMPDVVKIMKRSWFASVMEGSETFAKRIEKLKRGVGISPIYDSVFTVWEFNGAKYKPVVKKVVPVSMQDPDVGILAYTEIQIELKAELLELPKWMEELKFTKKLMKEWVLSIISKIPAGFLTKTEAELLIHIFF